MEVTSKHPFAAQVASFTDDEEWAYSVPWGWSDAPDPLELVRSNDDNSHGTHCSGVAAGNSVGVAPGADLYHMKILDGFGAGDTAWELSAMDAIASVVEAGHLDGRAVLVSLSVGGPCASGAGSKKGASMSLQLVILAMKCVKERVHSSRTRREMISRPKMSRNE